MVSRIIIFTLFLGMASAAVWMGHLPEKPAELAHKEGCYIEEIKDVIPFGATITPLGHCVRIHCGGMIDYASCGIVGAGSPDCYVTDGDLRKPYPQCCPDVKCEADNNIV